MLKAYVNAKKYYIAFNFDIIHSYVPNARIWVGLNVSEKNIREILQNYLKYYTCVCCNSCNVYIGSSAIMCNSCNFSIHFMECGNYSNFKELFKVNEKLII